MNNDVPGPTPSEEPLESMNPEPADNIPVDELKNDAPAGETPASAEQSPTADDAGKSADSADGKKKTKKKKEKRSWRRRFALAGVVVLIVALCVRIVLWAALPIVLHKTAAFYDLDLNYERMSFSTLDGEVALWHMTVAPRGGGETIAATDYVHGQISVLNLLRGRLDVWRMEADGVDLAVQRNADGTVPLIEKFMSGPAAKSSTAATPAGKIDLTPPAAIDAFRLQHIRAHVRDLSVTPPLDTVVALDLRVDDVGSASRPTQFEVDVTSDPVLDDLVVQGEGHAAGSTLDATLRVKVRGLHGKPAAGYLAPLGIHPVADAINMDMTGTVKIAPSGQLTLDLPTTGPTVATRAPTSRPASPAAPADALAARVELKNIGILADGQESAAVDRVTIYADSIAPGQADIARISVDGVRAGAYRDAAGTFHAAGLQYSPVPAMASSNKPVPVGAASPAAKPMPQVAPAFKWSIGELSVSNVKATFADQAITPPADLAFIIDQFSVLNVVGDPARPDAELTIAGQFRAPGMARSIRIDGKARPFAEHKSFTLDVRAQGVKPDAIRQYLDVIGLESQLKDASFACGLQGSLSVVDGKTAGQLRLGDVRLDDGEQLLAFDGVKVDGIQLNPAGDLYHVDSIEVSGPALAARREASGALSGLGFRLDPARFLRFLNQNKATADQGMKSAQAFRVGEPTRPLAAQLVAVAATGVPASAVKQALAQPAATSSIPRIEIGRLVWKDVKVSLDDRFAGAGSTIAFSDAGIELSDMRVDMNDTRPGRPGKFKAWASAPGVADRLAIEGTVTPGANAMSLDMSVVGRGLAAGILAPYLKGLGVEPTLQHGSLDLHATLDLTNTDDGFNSTISLNDVRYAEGDSELAGVDRLRIEGLAVGKSGASIGSVEIDRPRASVVRDADGSFLAGGVKLTLPLPAAPTAQPSAGAAKFVALGPTTRPATAPSTVPTTLPATQPGPFVTMLNKLRIRGGALSWTDRAVQPVAAATATVDLDLDHFNWGGPHDAAALHLRAKTDNSLDELTVDGSVFASKDSDWAKLEVKATGLRAGTLAPYIPSGTVVTLKDGRFHANIDAAVEMPEGGGESGHLLLDQLDFRDGDSPAALFKLDSAAIRVARADLPDNALALDEISVMGLETAAEKSPDGTLHLLGLSVGAAPVTQPAATQPAGAATSQPIARPAVAVTTPSSAPVNAAEVVARSHKVLPLITVEKLDLNVSRASFIDGTRPASAPLVVSGLRLRNRGRIEVLGPAAASRPPVKLELTGAADPVVGGFKIDTQLAPFAEQPTVAVEIAADRIRGDGLTAIAPELKEYIDGAALTDGRFKAKFEAQARIDRKSPIDFDPKRPFELDFDLSGVEFRAVPNGPVAAGVEEVRTEGARISPAKGDVIVHALEITKPTARILRDKEGVRTCGLLYRLPALAATTPPPTKPAIPPATTVVAQRSTAIQPAVPTSRPSNEVRVDKITISGMDVVVEDRSVDPPFIAPLNGLEVEVLGFSTQALYEPRPIRFDATVSAGKVHLPKRGAPGTLEERDLFAQVATSGQMVLYPQVKGWAKSTVSGFELASLSGEAKQAGANLSGGTFDEAVDLRFQGDGSMDLRTKTILTDLAYQEPSGGLVQSFLHLQGTVDFFVGIVQDADGSITLPVEVPVKKGHLDQGEIVGSATGAVAGVLVTAAASAPLKAANAVTSVLPIPGLFGEKKKAPDQPIVLSFPTGSTSLEPAALAALTPLLKRLHDEKGLEIQLKQELGGGDVDRARIRANPSPQECSALIYRLHQRKLELQGLRGRTAGRARALLASRADAEAAVAVSQLHSIDRELAQTEDGLDKLYDLLRPGAARQTDRRTRAASLEIAAARLEAVKALLVASGVPDADKRVKTDKPQFNPTGNEGGTVTLKLVPKKQ